MKTHLAIALGFALGSGWAVAADMPKFEDADADQDGVISLTEAEGHDGLVTVFTEADADKDGKLSKEEYDAIK